MMSRYRDVMIIHLPPKLAESVLAVLSVVAVWGLLPENRAVAGVIGTDITTFERLHSRLYREERDRFLIREEVRHDTEKCVAIHGVEVLSDGRFISPIPAVSTVTSEHAGWDGVALEY
jgi:hypothetical protein